MRRLGALLPVLAALSLCGCPIPWSHGPAEDHSRFVGAALLDDRTVLFSFKRLVYRPARGIAAFPDGGVPHYDVDEDLLGAFDLPTGELRVLRREPNRRWSSGQGGFSVGQARGSAALVTRGGQLRNDLARLAYEDWIVDVAAGTLRPLRWREALAERGLAMKQLHLLDARGTLLFATAPASAATGSRADEVWLWVRTAEDRYVKVARTSHQEGMVGDELVYWIPETRRFRGFNVVTLADRDLPGFRVPSRERVDEGVAVETGGRRLLLGRRSGDAWAYEPLPIEPDDLR